MSEESDVAREELEVEVRRHLRARRGPSRSVGRTRLISAEGDWDQFGVALRSFFEEPLLQQIVLALADERDAGRRLSRLTLALIDSLQASADHDVRQWDSRFDTELAIIVSMALTADERRHGRAMKMFVGWERRKEAAYIESLRARAGKAEI